MSVRFADAPRVVEYALHDFERDLKRRSQATINQEYLREKRLYALVFQWKRANPQDAVLQLNSCDQRCLLDFMGQDRAAVAQHMGVAGFSQLLQAAIAFTLDKWPSHQINGDREYEATCMIVLTLVAEFLCQHFRYDLSQQEEQSRLYYNVFHIAQKVLQCYQ